MKQPVHLNSSNKHFHVTLLYFTYTLQKLCWSSLNQKIYVGGIFWDLLVKLHITNINKSFPYSFHIHSYN